MAGRGSLAPRLVAATLWAALLGVTLFASPPPAPDTNAQVLRLLTGHVDDRCLFALFYLMGVWPMAMAVALRGDSAWKWPFLVGSLAAGSFALLPWLVLRPWGEPPSPRSRADRALGSRGFRVFLGVAAVVLVAVFFSGDLVAFAQRWRTEQFPFVMSLDFVAMALAWGLLALERRKR
jgi:hypothetical protein